jgi:hypothetical protein
MKLIHLQCSTRLPALLNLSPAEPRRARHHWSHCATTRHAPHMLFIVALATNSDGAGSLLTPANGVRRRPAQVESP